jgi:hypothetical protein
MLRKRGRSQSACKAPGEDVPEADAGVHKQRKAAVEWNWFMVMLIAVVVIAGGLLLVIWWVTR